MVKNRIWKRGIIEKEKGPSLSLPDEISFGEVAIPTEDKVVFPITKDKAQIEDYSKLDRSRWKVKVKEEQPLTNEDQKILSSAFNHKRE